MAQQKGILPLQGTIGNINFYKSKDGFLAREKGGVSAEKIATDPRFARTRENNSEFGRACKAGKLLRDAFRVLLQVGSDSTLIARLTSQMMKVIKLDSTSTRGLRNVLDGELEILEGFNGNIGSVLSAVFYAPFSPTIVRVTGELKISIPPFIPSSMVAAPTGATHCKIYAAGACIDFENFTMENGIASTSNLLIGNQLTTAANLLVTLTANASHPLFLAMAIEFLQEVNGTYYPLKNGSFNSMCLVKVQGI